MSEVDVIRVRNPHGLLMPEIMDLLKRGLAANSMVEDVPAALNELATQLHRDDLALLLGYEGTVWKGMALAQWGGSAFNPGCVVVHFYTEGTKELRTALVQAIADYAKDGGYGKIIGLDMNDKPRAFAKLFSAVGKPIFKGEVVVFDMNEGLI